METSMEQNSSPKYKGVRKRKWGKWVSEIRLPNSRERIWLGSFDSPVKAARAFDAALYCLRGPGANFNFPENPPEIPGGRSLTPQEIQVVANRFANNEKFVPRQQQLLPRSTEVGISAREEIDEVVGGTTEQLVDNNSNSNGNGNSNRAAEVVVDDDGDDDDRMRMDWSVMLDSDGVGPPTEFGYFPGYFYNDEHNLFFPTQHNQYSSSSSGFYDDVGFDDFSHHSLNLWNFH